MVFLRFLLNHPSSKDFTMKNPTKFLAVLAGFVGFGTSMTSCESWGPKITRLSESEKVQYDSLVAATNKDINAFEAGLDSALKAENKDTTVTLDHKKSNLANYYLEVSKELNEKHPTLKIDQYESYDENYVRVSTMMAAEQVNLRTILYSPKVK